MTEINIDFAGLLLTLDRGEELSFGREADLEIDTNPFLHRRLGRFHFQQGGWWVANTGSAIPLEVCDLESSSRMTVAPGTSAPLTFPRCVVRFQAGPSVYELVLAIAIETPDAQRGADLGGTTTVTASGVALNLEQRLLLVALAERRLRDWGLGRSALPTNRETADRLGWTITKFNRKLDNLCVKFHKLGVRGLKGDQGALAGSRRENLVDYALTVGVIAVEDLSMLDGVTST